MMEDIDDINYEILPDVAGIDGHSNSEFPQIKDIENYWQDVETLSPSIIHILRMGTINERYCRMYSACYPVIPYLRYY